MVKRSEGNGRRKRRKGVTGEGKGRDVEGFWSNDMG